MTVCGLHELDLYCARGITDVLSILDPDFPQPDVFKSYRSHSRTTLHFHDDINPAPDLVLPQIEHIATILDFGRSLANYAGGSGERHILAHCHMGISRSTAAMATILASAYPDEAEETIFTHLLQLRPDAWPNCLMILLADHLLERSGRLTAALSRLYAVQLAKRPELGTYLRNHGRGREVDMAAWSAD